MQLPKRSINMITNSFTRIFESLYKQTSIDFLYIVGLKTSNELQRDARTHTHKLHINNNTYRFVMKQRSTLFSSRSGQHFQLCPPES